MNEKAWEFLRRGTSSVVAHVSVIPGFKWQRHEDFEFQASFVLWGETQSQTKTNRQV